MGGGSSKKEKPLEIDRLNDDMVVYVLSFFDEMDVFGNFCFVSKNFNRICNHVDMWKVFCKRRYKDMYKNLRKKFLMGEDEDETDWRSLYLCLNSFRGSKVLKKGSERYRMNKLFGNVTQQWRILYRGTDNTFDGDPFHSRVDEHKGTITLIQCKDIDSIFGGFSPCKWHSYSSYSWDPATFLFSLKRDGKYAPVKFKNEGRFKRSIYGTPQQLAVFGWGPDLSICQDCKKVKESFSNLGESFSIPEHLEIAEGSEEAKTFFAGEKNFLVKEMEVYQRSEESKIVKQSMPM